MPLSVLKPKLNQKGESKAMFNNQLEQHQTSMNSMLAFFLAEIATL